MFPALEHILYHRAHRTPRRYSPAVAASFHWPRGRSALKNPWHVGPSYGASAAFLVLPMARAHACRPEYKLASSLPVRHMPYCYALAGRREVRAYVFRVAACWELGQLPTNMTQKPVLLVEVGACALRVLIKKSSWLPVFQCAICNIATP